MVRIGIYRLVMTCGACPEQYDVFDGDEKVGYLRLRHGSFSVSYPDYGGKVVFEASPEGDGCFTAEERVGYLKAAVAALDAERLQSTLDKIHDEWGGGEG